jgi:hypothetical protein
MKPKRLISALVFCLAFASFGCETIDKLTATNIKEILDHPRDYENKEITIYGTVTDATSILFREVLRDSRQYRQDQSRNRSVTSGEGEKLKVTGRTDFIEVSSERWVVFREKSKPDKSEKARRD